MVFKQEGHRAGGKAERDALEEIEEDKQAKVTLVLLGEVEKAMVVEGGGFGGDGGVVVEGKGVAGHEVGDSAFGGGRLVRDVAALELDCGVHVGGCGCTRGLAVNFLS